MLICYLMIEYRSLCITKFQIFCTYQKTFITDRLKWGENYLQSPFKVAAEILVARKPTVSLHERASIWKHENSW